MKNTLFVILGLLISIAASSAVQTKIVEGKDLLKGAPVRVSAERKKGLVIVFLSAKCPCSNSHNTELRELSENYKEFNFVAVHSNVDEGQDLSKPYFENAHFPFPVIEDENAKIADQLQAYKTPHSFIFSATGEVLYEGGVSNSQDCTKSDRKYLREALEDLHVGRKVQTPMGRTLGCVISRGEKNVW